MKLKDFQLPRYFILNEINLRSDLVDKILNYDIEVYKGDSDLVVSSSNKIKIYSPSSVTKFIYNILYESISSVLKKDYEKDILSLGLFYVCKNYVYENHSDLKTDGPPVLVSADKILVPSTIIREIIEPLVGKIDKKYLFFFPCNNIDSCKIINSYEELFRMYNIDRNIIPYGDYPIILVNCKVSNSASQLSHVTTKWMESFLGEEKTRDILRTLFLDQSSNLLKNLITVLKVLKGDADFVVDFLGFLQSGAMLTDQESDRSLKIQYSCIQEDKYLNKLIKAADGGYSREPMKQWSQWSLLVGLIEKQLDAVRGSMWPVSEKMSLIDKKKKKLITEKAKKRNKNQLTTEEMLEVVRDFGGHVAPKPGKIHETLLIQNRVWK